MQLDQGYGRDYSYSTLIETLGTLCPPRRVNSVRGSCVGECTFTIFRSGCSASHRSRCASASLRSRPRMICCCLMSGHSYADARLSKRRAGKCPSTVHQTGTVVQENSRVISIAGTIARYGLESVRRGEKNPAKRPVRRSGLQLASRTRSGGGGRTRTCEAMRRLIYSQLPLPLGTLPRSTASRSASPCGAGGSAMER
jgi:hypothetical protein